MNELKRLFPVKIDSNSPLLQDPMPILVDGLEKLAPCERRDYLLRSYLSKFVSEDTDPAIVRRQRAINKWLAVERNNEATNERLLTIDEEFNILPRVGYRKFMDRVRGIIQEILGEVPPSDVILGSFSGGASTSRQRTRSHPSSKYLGEAHITSRATGWWDLVCESSPLWMDLRLFDPVTVVPGNVLFTVPKTTEIDRCAAKEPDLSMYMQKGVGNYIRGRLRKFGIDLNDQSRNRRLAREGSISGLLATIDLSSASDSVTTGLVLEALPIHWYVLLSDLRSPRTLIDGVWHENEMFSSMGNGFTFELESLLFYAIARATAWCLNVPGIISVYGDDIVCPSEIAPELMYALSVLGFESNTDKSFYEGPFRESCGGHFINGLDITPFYVRKPVTYLIDLIHLCNSLRKWAEVEGMPVLDPEVYSLWSELASQVPDVFWGGHDTADKTRLVSPPRGDVRRRLSPNRKSVPTGKGGYLHWHDSVSNDGGSTLNVSMATRVVERPGYKVRPVRAYQPLTHLFPQEVMCQGS